MIHTGDTIERGGVGADTAPDPDKAYKTALAEAIKKAGNQFGIALELWDADHRDNLDAQRKIGTMNLNQLKGAVVDRAGREGVDLDVAAPLTLRKNLVTHFGLVDAGELDNPDVLREVLRRV